MKIENYQEATEALHGHLRDYLEEHGIDTSKAFTCITEHEDKTPSCHVMPDGILWKCFGCGACGQIFHAAHHLENKPMVGTEFLVDNLGYLAEKYKIELNSEALTEEEIYELSTYRAYRAAANYIANNETTDAFNEAIAKRGWNKEFCEQFGVGCLPDYKQYRQRLKDLGFTATFIDDVDLGRKEIFGPDRLIFTVHDDRGRPVGFMSRNLGSEGAKYVNQKHTGIKCNIYQKSNRLYLFHHIVQLLKVKEITTSDPIYIFEGPTDALTAKYHGLDNCVALCGTAMSLEQIQLIKQYGFYNIVLCLDGDKAGKDRTAALLDSTLGGHRDFSIKIVTIPEEKDPDDFIRKEGVEEFKRLMHWTAFEWRLNQFSEDIDPGVVCKSMIPLIVNEPSYINRDELCEILSKNTGQRLKTIQSEVSRLTDQKEGEKQRDRGNIIDQMVTTLKRNPDQALFAMREAESALTELDKKYDQDSFSVDVLLSVIENKKRYEESKDGTFSGFLLGSDLKYLQNAMNGNWKKDCWGIVGGKPNSGKTSFLCKLAYSIASILENNALVIYHTIDDSTQDVISKFTCIAEGSRNLQINYVGDPNYHCKNGGPQDLGQRRNLGYESLMKVVRDERLVIKDANDGSSLAYAESLIRHFKQRHPDRNVVYILDNFHKLDDFGGKSDERVRFKELSKHVKNMATRYHICIISTAEYRKVKSGNKAGNDDIGETGQIEYDANFIWHLHNEMHEDHDASSLHHEDNGEMLPTIEINVGKNKVTSFKDKLWFDFYPTCSDFKEVSKEEVVDRRAEEAKESGLAPEGKAEATIVDVNFFGGKYANVIFKTETGQATSLFGDKDTPSGNGYLKQLYDAIRLNYETPLENKDKFIGQCLKIDISHSKSEKNGQTYANAKNYRRL